MRCHWIVPNARRVTSFRKKRYPRRRIQKVRGAHSDSAHHEQVPRGTTGTSSFTRSGNAHDLLLLFASLALALALLLPLCLLQQDSCLHRTLASYFLMCHQASTMSAVVARHLGIPSGPFRSRFFVNSFFQDLLVHLL